MQLTEKSKRQQKFLVAASSVVVLFWFFCCISLYWSSPVYQLQIGQLYESRWLLSSLGVSVFLGALFLYNPCSLLYSALFVATQYTIVYSAISFFVYTFDSIAFSTQTPSTRRNELIRYLRLSLTLIFLSLVSFFLSVICIKRLVSLAWDCLQSVPTLCKKLIQGLFSDLLIIACSACIVQYLYILRDDFLKNNVNFFLLLKPQNMALMHYPAHHCFRYIQSYTIQQSCCALLAFLLATLQTVLSNKSNTLVAQTIVVINICQFAQELAHAWSAYYVCIYIKSIAAHVETDLAADQIMISITLLVHGFRIILCALVIASLCSVAYEREMKKRISFKADPERLITAEAASRASRSDHVYSHRLFYGSTALAFAYLAADITYFILSSTRRTLSASTGISLFYALFIALSYHVYKRDHLIVALKIGAVFCIILIGSSAHAIYMFLQEAILNSAAKIFDDFFTGFLHGVDLFLALWSTVLSIMSLSFNTKTILLNTVLQAQPRCITGSLKMLNHLATINLLMLALEFCLILIMKLGWRLNDPAVNFGILDWISVLSTCILQKWICLYERYQSCLLILILQLVIERFTTLSVLIFQLVIECLTTLSVLSAQTNYIQLMISLARSNANIDKLKQLLPIDHLIIILIDHSLQVLQWAIALCSLGFSLIILNDIVTEPPSEEGEVSQNCNQTQVVAWTSNSSNSGCENSVFDDDTVQIVIENE